MESNEAKEWHPERKSPEIVVSAVSRVELNEARAVRFVCTLEERVCGPKPMHPV